MGQVMHLRAEYARECHSQGRDTLWISQLGRSAYRKTGRRLLPQAAEIACLYPAQAVVF